MATNCAAFCFMLCFRTLSFGNCEREQTATPARALNERARQKRPLESSLDVGTRSLALSLSFWHMRAVLRKERDRESKWRAKTGSLRCCRGAAGAGRRGLRLFQHDSRRRQLIANFFYSLSLLRIFCPAAGREGGRGTVQRAD